jgi:DNA polymerase-3 subunit alpha
MDKFVHLHLHTEYSLLDGAVRIKDLMDKAAQFRMPAVAMTDHGVMYGAVDFYKEALEKGVKPIMGCEIYMAKRSRFDKEHVYDTEPSHLVLLAKDNIGYRNLMKIVSRAHLEGFYYKPRADYELLTEYSEGLIALSACLAGAIPRAIMNGDHSGANEIAEKYKNIFGEGNFYFELQNNGIESQHIVNQALIEMSKNLGIPLVATNDVHYLNRQDAEPHDVLLCIQTGKTVDEPDRMRFPTDEFYFKGNSEMQELFSNIPEALENSLRIADMCNVELDLESTHLPAFRLESGSDHYDYLKEKEFI